MTTTTWMQTYSGRIFHPHDPAPDTVDMMDVAVALSHTCRFGGHCIRFLSVAEHCCLVHDYVSATTPRTYPLERSILLRQALLHDAGEAYWGDMIRPLKSALPGFRELEHRCRRAVMIAAGLSGRVAEELPQAVLEADFAALKVEMLVNTNCINRAFVEEKLGEPLPRLEDVHPTLGPRFLTPVDAQWQFLARLRQLR